MSQPTTFKESSEPAPGEVAVLHYVLCYDDLLAERSVALELPERAGRVRLGRGENEVRFASAHEIALPDPWVSVKHATLVVKPGSVTIEDEGSSNGTFVNGARVAGSQPLEDGNLIEVGHSLLCYRRIDARARSAVLSETVALGPTRTRSAAAALLVRDLERIAPSDEPVLLLGETGVGKEVVADSIHRMSGRTGPFRAVDCGAVPEPLFEATFFGHRRGAFTGAVENRVGEIDRAHEGTLFLDEVANMDLSSQAKLLRVLETRAVTPLGSSEPRVVDVRWVAATNSRFVEQETAFRQDLLQRLAGYVARVPALRHRREDLGCLTAHFLREARAKKVAMTAPAGRQLFNEAFPGNLRQLRATLRRAALLAADEPIDVRHLALAPAAPPAIDEDDAPPKGPPKRRKLDVPAIDAALTATGGNVVRAAEQLELHPKQLYRWMDRLGVRLDKYRE